MFCEAIVGVLVKLMDVVVVGFFSSSLVGGFTMLPSANIRISRGHRCRSFFSPVRAFTFIANRVQHSNCLFVDFQRMLLLINNPRSRAVRKSVFVQGKVLTSEYMHSARLELTKIDLSRHAGHLPTTMLGRKDGFMRRQQICKDTTKRTDNQGPKECIKVHCTYYSTSILFVEVWRVINTHGSSPMCWS